MGKDLTRAQLKKLYLPPTDDFTFVDVPRMQFFMVDGKGDPEAGGHAKATEWLWATVYPIRRIAKERMGKNFVEPPLEGLWWAKDAADFVAGRKDKLLWCMMIPAADWMDAAMFADAVDAAAERLGRPPKTLRLEHREEGRCVQIMHVGPPAGQVATLQRLHGTFLPEQGLTANGPHHEIYLNDPSRTAPAKLKTVLRQPVLDCS